MEELAFVTALAPGSTPMDLYLLAASIREFGGELAEAPIWICVPHGQDQGSGRVMKHLKALGIEWLPFPVDQSVLDFPFGARVQAGAAAEKHLAGKTSRLAWLDTDTLVLNEPDELLLSPGKVFGYRPVHHRLLGAAWGEDLGPFWDLIYRKCQAAPDLDQFMVSSVGEKIRPYFNAGSIVVRPEGGLQERWWQEFRILIQDPDFRPFFEKDFLFRIFMHQAVLTGVVLSAVGEPERIQFSARVNYPLHLHGDIPEQLRARSINDLITVRCESLLSGLEWKQLPIQDPLLSWLEDQLAQVRDLKDKS